MTTCRLSRGQYLGCQALIVRRQALIFAVTHFLSTAGALMLWCSDLDLLAEIRPVLVGMQAVLHREEEAWVHSGAEATDEDFLNSGAAAFVLSVLASSGLAAPVVPADEAFAVYALQRALEAGDRGAYLAMANRLFEGRGVEQDCGEGMR